MGLFLFRFNCEVKKIAALILSLQQKRYLILRSMQINMKNIEGKGQRNVFGKRIISPAIANELAELMMAIIYKRL